MRATIPNKRFSTYFKLVPLGMPANIVVVIEDKYICLGMLFPIKIGRS